ncbi:MAG: CTP synthase [Cytophagales bacterium]|nr:CTP synthase [Cytophagales bacterium]
MSRVKYIFVTGGVTSSLGKGIVSASLAKLLQARGLSVTIQKFDPYINVDPGTLNPYEHGECYVTDDGAETDLDLGHYERFLNVPTSQANNVTTGRIYYTVITKEREGAFLGKTVQVVPHITDEIKRNFKLLAESGKYDVIITEIGGCVGDIEALPFIEAVRQFKWEEGEENIITIHLTLVPFLKSAGELKTKPTQHSVKMLSESGIQPDILVCRTEYPLTDEIKRKIALFSNVSPGSVIESIDAQTIYEVPLLMLKEKLDIQVLQKLKIEPKYEPDLDKWNIFLSRLKNPESEVTIGLIGKYTELKDAYKSIAEALIHAGSKLACKVNILWMQSEKLLDDNVFENLINLDGIIVAPGFGERGFIGKLNAVRTARQNNIPFFGICLGMQCAVVEFARNVLNYPDANSTEMDANTSYPVIDMMEGQKKITQKGGTMRLGAFPCKISKNTIAHKLYGNEHISERHRHRYEFNNTYLQEYEKAGMIASGINPDSGLVEIVELSSHPFFVGTQFHPELKSTVLNPHPLFVGFVKASLEYSKE